MVFNQTVIHTVDPNPDPDPDLRPDCVPSQRTSFLLTHNSTNTLLPRASGINQENDLCQVMLLLL